MNSTNKARNPLWVNIVAYILFGSIAIGILIFIAYLPLNNWNYSARLVELTKDQGWDIIKLINCEKGPETVSSSKNLFQERIKELQGLTPSFRIVSLFDKSWTTESGRNQVLAMYQKFFDSSYFLTWKLICEQSIERKSAYEEYKNLDIKYSSQAFNNSETGNMKARLYLLSDQMASIDGTIKIKQGEAEAIYTKFAEEIKSYMTQ